MFWSDNLINSSNSLSIQDFIIHQSLLVVQPDGKRYLSIILIIFIKSSLYLSIILYLNSKDNSDIENLDNSFSKDNIISNQSFKFNISLGVTFLEINLEANLSISFNLINFSIIEKVKFSSFIKVSTIFNLLFIFSIFFKGFTIDCFKNLVQKLVLV